MPQRRGIGQAELEILNYIHDHHPATVRQVADHVAATKGHTRTTVLNVMTRLVNKGYLTRRRSSGAADGRGVYAYSPRVPKPDLLRTLVGDFVSRALGGSLSPFVAYLAQDARLTDADVADLRRLLQELETRPPESRRAKGGGK